MTVVATWPPAAMGQLFQTWPPSFWGLFLGGAWAAIFPQPLKALGQGDKVAPGSGHRVPAVPSSSSARSWAGTHIPNLCARGGDSVTMSLAERGPGHCLQGPWS